MTQNTTTSSNTQLALLGAGLAALLLLFRQNPDEPAGHVGGYGDDAAPHRQLGGYFGPLDASNQTQGVTPPRTPTEPWTRNDLTPHSTFPLNGGNIGFGNVPLSERPTITGGSPLLLNTHTVAEHPVVLDTITNPNEPVVNWHALINPAHPNGAPLAPSVNNGGGTPTYTPPAPPTPSFGANPEVTRVQTAGYSQAPQASSPAPVYLPPIASVLGPVPTPTVHVTPNPTPPPIPSPNPTHTPNIPPANLAMARTDAAIRSSVQLRHDTGRYGGL